MDFLIKWDTRLFLFLNNLGSAKYDAFWLYFTNEFSWIPIYFILIILLYERLGWEKLLRVLVSIAIMIVVVDNFTNLIKYLVKRPRPCRNPALDGLFRLVIEKCSGKYCFFSAHAANSFALACYLTPIFHHKYKYAPFLFFLWAILVSYSRIYVGVHFPLDILIGTFVGVLWGYLFSKSQKFIL